MKNLVVSENEDERPLIREMLFVFLDNEKELKQAKGLRPKSERDIDKLHLYYLSRGYTSKVLMIPT